MSTPLESFLRFEPIYQTRVWGGRALEEKLARELPDPVSPYGESWEISAREEADGIVRGGTYEGKRFTELWQNAESRASIFGPAAPVSERFPLLCKILDAREKLSIQVHPPASVAGELGGEPKTEVWYVAHAEPGAMLYVGVKEGVTPDSFRDALEQGTAEESVHAVPVKSGDHLFIPSGRLHAIGAGLLIYEMQQNSDTTYRVYDWNRIGLDGEPRELHIEESMRCIDFDDIEPGVDLPDGDLLCECEHFRLEKHILREGESLEEKTRARFSILAVVSGSLESGSESFRTGDFFLVPSGAGGEAVPVASNGATEVLLTTWGTQTT